MFSEPPLYLYAFSFFLFLFIIFRNLYSWRLELIVWCYCHHRCFISKSALQIQLFSILSYYKWKKKNIQYAESSTSTKFVSDMHTNIFYNSLPIIEVKLIVREAYFNFTKLNHNNNLEYILLEKERNELKYYLLYPCNQNILFYSLPILLHIMYFLNTI